VLHVRRYKRHLPTVHSAHLLIAYAAEDAANPVVDMTMVKLVSNVLRRPAYFAPSRAGKRSEGVPVIPDEAVALNECARRHR